MGNAEYMGKLNLKLEKIIKMKLAATLVVVASAGKVKDPVKRLNKLRGHAETLLDLADNNTTTNDNNIARANKWVSKVFDQAAEIDTTFPCPTEEVADEAVVSTRKTSASSTVRSPPLSDPSSENTAAKARSPRRTSPTPSPSEPAECETSLPELPTAKHSNNSTLFLTFNCIDKNNKIFVLKKKKS